jgi:hypothetical protein
MSATAVSLQAFLPATRLIALPTKTLVPRPVRKTKIFDSSEGFGPITNLGGLTDATLAKRGDQWWLYLAGLDRKKWTLNLWSASLPAGSPLESVGWTITTVPNDPQSALELVPSSEPGSWDGSGGRHCPSYVRGWDPALNGGAGGWEERLYYAGSAGGFAGPYSIGFLTWSAGKWRKDPSGPVSSAAESWEFNSVCEPNLIYHEGKWRMWYAAGPDESKNMIQGYAESHDGRTNWKRQLFWPATENVFDQTVLAANDRFEAVLARKDLSGKPTPHAGLWWMQSREPSGNRAAWGQPSLLLDPFDGTSWHNIGVWKPSLQYSDADPKRLFIVFDGASTISANAGAANRGMPFNLTLGCLECELQ